MSLRDVTAALPVRRASAMGVINPRGIEWNETQMIVRIPKEDPNRDKSMPWTMEELMQLEDLPQIHLGSLVKIVVGMWFPARHAEDDILIALKPLDGIVVTIESTREDSVRTKSQRDSPLSIWTHAPSDKEQLDVVKAEPWQVLSSAREMPEKTLAVRQAYVQFRSRYASGHSSTKSLVVSLREVVDDWVDRGLKAVLDEAAKMSTITAPTNRLLAKTITLDVPVSLKTRLTSVPGKSIVSITAENHQRDLSVVALWPMMYTGSSLVISTATRLVMQQHAESSAGQQYFFKAIVDADADQLTSLDSIDWDDFDRLPVGAPVILGPGELYEFVYTVERRPGATALPRGLSFLCPVSVSWSCVSSPMAKMGSLDRRQVNTSVFELVWRPSDATAEVSIGINGPQAVAAAQKFDVEIVTWNHGEKDVESGVLRVVRGSLLPLRSSIVLGRIHPGSSVAVSLACVSFSNGVAGFKEVNVSDESANFRSWTAEDPYEVLVDSAAAA